MNSKTATEFNEVIARCKALFLDKAKDYGTAWQVLRPSSITDQLLIKARRIRQIEDTGENKVGDSITSEFIGIINYCVIALIILDFDRSHLDPDDPPISLEQLPQAYDNRVNQAWQTLLAKNHDYGEAWRAMLITSFTDLILMKLYRVRQIEQAGGKTLVSEGVAANYIDVLNYAVFALIKLGYATPDSSK